MIDGRKDLVGGVSMNFFSPFITRGLAIDRDTDSCAVITRHARSSAGHVDFSSMGCFPAVQRNGLKNLGSTRALRKIKLSANLI